MKNLSTILVLCVVVFQSCSFAETIENELEVGPNWSPLGQGTEIYANSFLAGEDGTVTDLSMWLEGAGPSIIFQIWGSLGGDPANGPNAADVLAETATFSGLDFTGTIEEHAGAVLAGSTPLDAGVTYWFVARILGAHENKAFTAGYHELNTGEYFLYSTNDGGVFKTGSPLTRGMAFKVTYTPIPVADTSPPDLDVPLDIIVEQATATGTEVTFTVTATDNIDPNPTVVCSPASGFDFPQGTTTVTCTATDESGNEATASFTITVQDTTPPVFVVVPGDLTVEQATATGTEVDFVATATDNIDANPTVVCSPPSGSMFPLGTTTVTCTATDESGNQATADFTITVEDTTVPVPGPVIVINLLQDTLRPPNGRLVHVANISASDLGDATLHVGVTSDEAIDECDWVWNEVYGRLCLRAERDGDGDGRVYTITVTAGDATTTAVVTVPHDQCDDDQDDKKNKGRRKGRKGRDRDQDDDRDEGKKNKGKKNNRGGRRGGRR